MPDRPFFAYYAPGATHAPHHVPKEWADQYTGQFDQGWDALREETFARQKELGVIPPDGELTERSPGIPAWDDIDPTRCKPILARQMEVYAGYLENTDHHVGLLLDALEDLKHPRRHADLRDHRRQRRLRRRVAAGHVQRDDHARRLRRAGDAEFMSSKIDAVRRAGGLQPLRRRLGARDGHAVPVDQAGRLALRRHPQRHDRALAGRDRRPRARSARSSTTSSTSRRPSSRPPGLPQPTFVNGVQQKPIEGVEHGLLASTTPAPPSATRRSTSRCSATAASTTRAGPR